MPLEHWSDFPVDYDLCLRLYHTIMSLATPIANGFTAEIYAWKDGQVLKLFNQATAYQTVELEARLTRIAHTAGLPVPAVGEILEIEGRFGLEYERVDGITMLEASLKQPWKIARYARQLAELQAMMHIIKVPEMPSLRERLGGKINRAGPLTENVRQAALRILEQLPEDDKLCHGDFHPGNILLTDRGAVIIDWIDAARGCPVADVARSTLLFGGGPVPPGFSPAWLIRIAMDWFYRIYRRRYFELMPGAKKHLAAWVPVCAAARLDENIHYDESRLISIAQTLTEKE